MFWPIAHLLNDAYGWRTPLVIFAALNLLLYAPLDWIGLTRRESPPQAQQAPAAATATVPGRPPLEGRARTLAMLLFGTIVAASAIVFGAMAAHLVPLLEASGLASATAVWIASLKGVAQVAGRIWDLTLARKWHPIDLGRVSVAIIALSFLTLMLGGANFVAALSFTLLFGIAQRAGDDHARRRAARPVRGQRLRRSPWYSGNALPVFGGHRPRAFALLVEPYGSCVAQATMLVAGLCSLLGMELMAVWYRRRQPG